MSRPPIARSDSLPPRAGRGWLLSFACLLLACYGALAYRLVDLQILRHAQLREVASDHTTRTVISEPRRGDIFDSHGNKLATSVFVKTVCADPSLLGRHHAEVARALAPVLKLDSLELEARLKPALRQSASGQLRTNRYVVLRRKVKPEMWEAVKKTLATLPLSGEPARPAGELRQYFAALRRHAIFADPVEDQERIYPSGALAAHVLGFVAGDEHAGREGVEAALDTHLTGARGWRVIQTDARKREKVEHRVQDIPARNGLNVVLTLDAGVQNIAETELAAAVKKHQPQGATVIVMRPATGDILAMVNAPSFDPNRPGDFDAAQRRNRAVTDLSEPGSTFKIVPIAAALNQGKTTLANQFHCGDGQFPYAGRVLHDHHPYGLLSVEGIITKSSNIGAAKVGMLLGAPLLHQYIHDFGFARKSGIQLPGEVAGVVHPLARWNALSITRLPMGHEMSATPLQMVMMMGAIANRGQLMQPRLVDHLANDEGQAVVRFGAKVVRQVIKPETALQMTRALKTVVGPEGTAKGARLPYHSVAGKTGTAQKPGPGGYLPGKYYSSFIGFFPADSPEVCILVSMDEPQGEYYGGVVAAPVFKAIGERVAAYLAIKPDLNPDASLVSADEKARARRP